MLELETSAHTNNGFSSVKVRYWDGKKEDVLCFLTNCFSTASVPDKAAVFSDVNDFLRGIDESLQFNLMKIYTKAFQVLDSNRTSIVNETTGEIQTAEMFLSDCMEEMIRTVTYEAIRRYVYLPGKMSTPPNLQDVFEQNGKNLEEWTYLRHDYYELLVYVMMCRFFIPIWGMYILSRKNDLRSMTRDANAYLLMVSTSIVDWPGYKRLYDYVLNNVESQPVSLSLVMASIGTATYDAHVMSQTLLRKLCMLPLQYDPVKDNNLVSAIFNLMINNVRRMDVRVGPVISKRPPSEIGASEDNTRAAIEMFRAKQGVSDGPIGAIEAFCQNLNWFAARISDVIPVSIGLIEECYKLIYKRDLQNILPFQTKFAVFLSSHMVGASSEECLSPEATMGIIAVAQAYLWASGRYELAVLLTAVRDEREPDPDVYVTPVQKAKITPEQREKLDEIYPYWKMTSRKQDLSKRNNCAVDLIEELADDVFSTDWIVSCPSELAREFGDRCNNNVFSISPLFKQSMADLIIAVNESR